MASTRPEEKAWMRTAMVILSPDTPLAVLPPFAPENRMHGGEYGSLGTWCAPQTLRVGAPFADAPPPPGPAAAPVPAAPPPLVPAAAAAASPPATVVSPGAALVEAPSTATSDSLPDDCFC